MRIDPGMAYPCGGFWQHAFGNRAMPSHVSFNDIARGQGRFFGENQFPQSMSPWSMFYNTDGRDQFRTKAKGHPAYTARNTRERNNSGFSEEDETGYKSDDTWSQGSISSGPDTYGSTGNIRQDDGPAPAMRHPQTSPSNGFPISQLRLTEQPTVSPHNEGSCRISADHSEEQHSPGYTRTVFEQPPKLSAGHELHTKPTGNQNNLTQSSTPNDVSHDKELGEENEPPVPYQQEEPKKSLTTVNKLQQIHDEVKDLKAAVVNFSGSRKSKQFLYLDEMLTRKLLMVDVIETEGIDEIRKKRKAVVGDINDSISLLEAKCEESDEHLEPNTDETPR